MGGEEENIGKLFPAKWHIIANCFKDNKFCGYIKTNNC
jgi:hypothetical protein